MTTLIDGELRVGLCWVEAHCRSLRFGRDDNFDGRRAGGRFVLVRGALQISPLRYASVEMTTLMDGELGKICVGSRRTADLSAPLRSGRDDNFDRRRAGGRFVLVRGALQISPLRYASVEMTTLSRRGLGGIGEGLRELQISPLRSR